MKDTYLQIRVSDNLKNDVKRLAANENKNISEYVTDLLKEKVIESNILGERKTMNIKDLYNNYRTYYRMVSEGTHVIFYIDFEEGECWVNEYTDNYSYTNYSSNYIVDIIAFLNNNNKYPRNYKEFKTLVSNIIIDDMGNIILKEEE